jgi:hypothetical protein
MSTSGVPLSGKETVDALADQWGKVLAIIMLKHKLFDVVLTKEDILALGDDEMKWALVPGPGPNNNPNEIRLQLMTIADAQAEAKKSRGKGFGKS